MKALRYIIILICAAAALTTSCRKNIASVAQPNQDSATTFSQVFEDYWTGMNTNYVFWSIDTTNWDNVYRAYKDSFATLSLNSQQDILKAYSYFKNMTRGLVDCHYYISFYNPVLADSSVDPALERKTHINPRLQSSFFANVVRRSYLDAGSFSCYSPFQYTFAGKTSTSYMAMVTGTIENKALYFRLNQFALQYLLSQDSSRYDTLLAGWTWFRNSITDTQYKGIIIDLRSNNGGYIEDLDYICGYLTDKPITFAYTHEKSGNGRLDYTPWIPAILSNIVTTTAPKVPIVVLTDQWSVSMAEMTTMALKCLPTTYIIGDTTWGANGPLDADVSLYGGGQFSFGHFGFVYTSSAMYKYRNGNVYENKGFPPDLYVPYDGTAINQGKDIQLEAAKGYLGL
jgi:carboxyl-terminal processing protease